MRFTLGLVGIVFGLTGLALVLAGHPAQGVAKASQHSDQIATRWLAWTMPLQSAGNLSPTVSVLQGA